ncbi:MAG: prepilin-type N-terminal cleavage/methylation domain-containing protein [Gammaproteobacteria bacterium]|nr:prepilin-type N-terminal cleavage/methylation domain-containing protein [Gammaproteobacteria bacterium]MBU1555797.1 prepilin-type N-terminal cleavage/methylation domain-containing protein [Gammaproteobacteria bacterium]MBU2069677.1 prepilin-type N-terminal cleavage/methylation domain-containing protein [Gammaproteobacteria bacterium]MBU2184542.1 prepilin-type N-terminal cleavage/methylation domain-containing protein [Gammaproteobacteria bacterium]MBU2205224.1 prepilin-type N-terminal cleavag
MANQRGLTLLEMLIATLILTAVLSLASSAYSYYVAGFNKSQDRIALQLRQAKADLSWQEQLSAAFDYNIKIDRYNYKPWFKGGNDSLSWVATTSMQQPGKAAVAWLGVKDNSLMYCERLLEQALFTRADLQPETLCNTYSNNIKPVSKMTVQYYSWPTLADRQNAMSESYPGMQIQPAAWFNQFDSFVTGVLPLFIKISLDTDETSAEYWVRLENIDLQRLGIFMSENNG